MNLLHLPTLFIALSTVLLFSCKTTRSLSAASKPFTATDSVWSSSNIAAFEEEIEALRERYHIPGLSVGIVNDKKLTWKRGFGYADIDHNIMPDEYTVYQVASVSKTFASILLMQQVESGKVNLDDPIAKYGIDLGARWGSDPRIKVKHLLTHTAMGNTFNGFRPGYIFRYNGDWYSQLGKVIEKAAGTSYGELLLQNIIRPLGLKHTVPSTDDSIDFKLTGYNKDSFLTRVAKPYDWQRNQLLPIKFTYGFGAAAGIMSCVADLVIYSNAIDEKRFLEPATWEKVFTPYRRPDGKIIQYGYGWFVKYYKGLKIIWHTGWWTGYSALFLKIPEKDLTFIILANSQDLSRPFYHLVQPVPGIGFFNPFARNLNKTILASDFGESFIDHFVRE